jgi:hypothetical protein
MTTSKHTPLDLESLKKHFGKPDPTPVAYVPVPAAHVAKPSAADRKSLVIVYLCEYRDGQPYIHRVGVSDKDVQASGKRIKVRAMTEPCRDIEWHVAPEDLFLTVEEAVATSKLRATKRYLSSLGFIEQQERELNIGS